MFIRTVKVPSSNGTVNERNFEEQKGDTDRHPSIRMGHTMVAFSGGA